MTITPKGFPRLSSSYVGVSRVFPDGLGPHKASLHVRRGSYLTIYIHRAVYLWPHWATTAPPFCDVFQRWRLINGKKLPSPLRRNIGTNSKWNVFTNNSLCLSFCSTRQVVSCVRTSISQLRISILNLRLTPLAQDLLTHNPTTTHRTGNVSTVHLLVGNKIAFVTSEHMWYDSVDINKDYIRKTS